MLEGSQRDVLFQLQLQQERAFTRFSKACFLDDDGGETMQTSLSLNSFYSKQQS